MGVVVETTLLRHVFAYYYRDTPHISYWRDAPTDKEVDIIVRSPAYVFPFEVKYREDPDLSASSGLAICCKQVKDVQSAYWVTKRDEDFGRVQLPGVDARLLEATGSAVATPVRDQVVEVTVALCASARATGAFQCAGDAVRACAHECQPGPWGSETVQSVGSIVEGRLTMRPRSFPGRRAPRCRAGRR
jgi:hypothetical protein